MLKNNTLNPDNNGQDNTDNNRGYRLNFNNIYNNSYRREAAQFTWLILSQYLLIFSLFLLFTTQMLFTGFSLLMMFGYFFSVIMNQVTASDKTFSVFLTGFALALAQDVTMTLPLTAKVIFLLVLAFHCHARLAKIINS
ncbi:hypothetical protein SG34_021335 [Thalassomonas viridans]|uniref:Uncharacterized protein n=1 Tax=Thalassomonas viridans TaxID=137584 RepID=A0AAE9Z0P9_9GAMM|nr:hypothetical protein [Thalassomonas viridans]WDE03894.1 hypothetical protein SG34_021335 [Thalassomonas viridans]